MNGRLGSQTLLMIMVARMALGDALYRLDDAGFGWRVEYVELNLLSMATKYVIFERETPRLKYDIRSARTLPAVRRSVAGALAECGFAPHNTKLVFGGAVSPPEADFCRVPRIGKR